MELKKRFSIGGLGGGIAALAIFAAASAAFVGVTNGSFESDLTGWTVDASVEVVGSPWQAADGTKFVDMGASPSAGKIRQDIATASGATYNVTFALAGNPTCTPTSSSWVVWITEDAIKHLSVSASGAPAANYTFDTTSTSVSVMGWTTQTYSFVATGSTTTLSFENLVSGNCGPALDNVVVSGGPVASTPTSADQCKNGGWQRLTDAQGNRFKNQGDCVSYVATGGKNAGAVAP